MTQLETAAVDIGTGSSSKAKWPSLTGHLRTAVRVLWILSAIIALGVLVASLPAYTSGLFHSSANTEAASQITAVETTIFTDSLDIASAVASLSASIVSLSLATLLFLRKSNDGMAMFVSFLMLTYGIVLAGPLERLALLWGPANELVWPAQTVLLATPILLLACLFPSGHFVPRWTRWVIPISLLWIPLAFMMPPIDTFSTVSPVAVAGIVVFAFCLPIVGIYAQIYRYKHVSSSVEKQQTKWIVYGLGLWFAWIIISSVPYMIYVNKPPDTPVALSVRIMGMMWWVAMNIIPVSLTISVMRYRLWDIDLVVNRTLVYGALTAIVVGFYVLIVGGMGILFQAQGSFLVALFATGLIAVLFQPLRDRVQRGANRLVYGERDDPVSALSQLGKRLEGTLVAEDVLPTLVESVAETLKLPYSAIGLESKDGYQIAAEYGKPIADTVEFPLVYQSEIIGRLVVAPRSPSDPFNPADLRLLRNIASQAGAAVHGVQLTIDLRRSQQKLVAAREEERRRLRRDIHDGLGPSLAAYMLTIGSARAAIPNDALLADRLLGGLEEDMEKTLGEIRRLVYNLRPPELDQLGLVGALTRYTTQYDHGLDSDQHAQTNRPRIIIQADEPSPDLPAAVESAAYRIVQEAVNNVVKHADARSCLIHLQFADKLRLTIKDDGLGMPEMMKAGVGLTSMRERAEELGGTFKILSIPKKGTTVLVELPLDGPSSHTLSQTEPN